MESAQGQGKALLSVGVDAILSHQPQPLNKTKVSFRTFNTACLEGCHSASASHGFSTNTTIEIIHHPTTIPSMHACCLVCHSWCRSFSFPLCRGDEEGLHPSSFLFLLPHTYHYLHIASCTLLLISPPSVYFAHNRSSVLSAPPPARYVYHPSLLQADHPLQLQAL